MNYIIHSMGFATAAVIVITLVLWAYGRKHENRRLKRSLRVVFIAAGVGFAMAWVLLAIYSIARHEGVNLGTNPLLYLCPTSILSMALDNAPFSVALLGWLVISITNAVLYSIIGMVAGAILFPLWKLNRVKIDN